MSRETFSYLRPCARVTWEEEKRRKMSLDQELLKILVCPLCKVAVELKEGGLFCPQCRRLYPIREEIPVMLVEEAKILPASPEE